MGECKLLVLINFLIISSLSFTFYLGDNIFWSQIFFFFFGGGGGGGRGAMGEKFAGANFPVRYFPGLILPHKITLPPPMKFFVNILSYLQF